MSIRGVLVDVNNGTVSDTTIDGGLHSLYSVCNCDCIDIVVRKIGGVKFNIVLDDIGLLKDGNIVSAIDDYFRPALVGNLFICKNYGPDLASISDEDLDVIMSKVFTLLDYDSGKTRDIIMIG